MKGARAHQVLLYSRAARPLFSDVKCIVDLQVALVIIIKELKQRETVSQIAVNNLI